MATFNLDTEGLKRAAKEAINNMRGYDVLMESNLAGTRIPKEPPKPIMPEEKWIWVEGYKGTNKDMQGHGKYQFEVGKRYDMPLDVEIQDCRTGFHLSLNMKDVFRHYPITNGNRFFKVLALVREKDYLEYGTSKKDDPYFYNPFATNRNKLASQSIEFIRELTLDEIFESVEEASGWSEAYKKMAIDIGVASVLEVVKVKELVALGYSEAFATYVVKRDRYDIAKVAASQPGLSMDVKALMIMNW